MSSSRSAVVWRTAVAAALIVTVAEVGVRLGGLTDFPTYQGDAGMGYIQRPGQAGKFLHENSWFFNDRSMGTALRWAPTTRPNILLIGNSIVIGGNPYDQRDKLGPLVQHGVGEGYSVWPIGAGGWTNVNETAYLEENPDVLRAANFFLAKEMLYSRGFSPLPSDMHSITDDVGAPRDAAAGNARIADDYRSVAG